MIQIPRLIASQSVVCLSSRADLQVENLVLRHQLAILKRSSPGRARLKKSDRFILSWLCRIWPKVASSTRRRWYGGIAKAFGSTGAGTRGDVAAGPGHPMKYELSSGG